MRRGMRVPCWALIFTLSATVASAADLSLVNAAKRQDGATVRALLDRKVDVNVPQPDGATALHWAVYHDDFETVDLLIRAGARVNAPNELGATPLYLACENGSEEIVERLLAAGANPNAALPSGETALMTASRSGGVGAVKALLARGADVRAREKTEDQTALMWAVSQKHPEVVQALIAAGADVRARSRVRHEAISVGEVDEGGYTPLLFAARQGDVRSARLLLAAGADVNDTAPLGTSALVVAAHSGHGPLGKLLLENGADPNAAGAGYTALHTAILRGELELVKALLAHKADPNTLLKKGSKFGLQGKLWEVPQGLVGATPFFLAAKFAEAPIMRALADAGADHATGLENGTTPLMVAAGLLTGGLSRGTKDRRGREQDTAVTELLRSQHPDERKILNSGIEAVKVAVALGADVNAANKAGDTALHGAAHHGFASVIQFLVDHGARFDVKNRRGQTPMIVAASNKEGDGQVAVDLLRRLGATE